MLPVASELTAHLERRDIEAYLEWTLRHGGEAPSILCKPHLAGGLMSDGWEAATGEELHSSAHRWPFTVISVTPTTRSALSFALLMVDVCGFLVGAWNGKELVKVALNAFLLSSLGESPTQSLKCLFSCGHQSLLLKTYLFLHWY